MFFAGGAREIGGSCIYLRVNDTGILMDAGIRQSASKDPLPDFHSIQEQGDVDYILISHAHMDHTGSLTIIISKAYPAAPIYMTPMTMDLTRILLADSIKIMNRKDSAAIFEKVTGWHLSIETAEPVQVSQDNEIILDAGKPMEQNAAIACIKNMFSDQVIQPYKISIKNNTKGRHLELSFISPEAGHQYDDLLKKCSDQTHWSLRILNSVNQNAAQMIAVQLCIKYNVRTKKAASYQPATHRVLIKTNDDIPDEMKREFTHQTGLKIDRK